MCLNRIPIIYIEILSLLWIYIIYIDLYMSLSPPKGHNTIGLQVTLFCSVLHSFESIHVVHMLFYVVFSDKLDLTQSNLVLKSVRFTIKHFTTMV